eukprot:TRINITY_DN10465_c0_g1_i2.p1 TRINITY_DN10465_c0_g1~~TRINITY_DN10465_c0_g1_i2.p1  ORF type:complete len:815 (+),score=173.41 TRINITY_DN10465_c0_g1_i2:23-2446(+)
MSQPSGHYGTVSRPPNAAQASRARRFSRYTSVDAELLVSGDYDAALTDHKQSIWKTIRKAVGTVLPPNKLYFKQQRVYEGLDYETTESEIEQAAKKQQTLRDHYASLAVRWLVFFIIGVITACIACSLDIAIMQFSKYKFQWLSQSISHCIRNDCLIGSFFYWVGLDVLLVTIAGFFVVYYAPVAQGSGIPEIKCFLNGIKMPEVVRLKTLFVKCVGVMFAVVGGMAVGKEGPMIHSGAVVAAGVSQGKSTSLPFINTPLFKSFRNDVDKRDFVSGGAAAGVSAAFGAPIGGVLFSLEEGSSFWSQLLTWRIFFASMTATFTLNILLSGVKGDQWGELSNPGLLNFGAFETLPYSVFEIPIFVGMGILGGLTGALFNHVNEKLTHFRMHYVKSRKIKLVEVSAIAALTVAVAFTLIFLSADCLPLGESPESSSPLQFFCQDHQYSAMASLFFNTPEDSIKNLFHAEEGSYNIQTLALFAVAYWALGCVTYGLAIPSGLFVPCLLTGAAWGRLVGTVLSLIFPNRAWTNPGKYALIGAAANLGGVVRMTISLTVIIIEATGNVSYGLPIIVVVLFAKWVGDYFNEGLYDIHIEMKHIPLLPWEPPPVACHNLCATDIMTRKIQCLRRQQQVGDVYDMLTKSRHNAFPVISWSNKGEHGLATFEGQILRSKLVVLLKHRAFGPRKGKKVVAKTLTPDVIQDSYPRWPSIDTIQLNQADREMWLDLEPYFNSSPYTVRKTSSLSRIFQLFRTVGLRHLAVVTKHNELVGMITRKDIANVEPGMTRRDFFDAMVASSGTSYQMPEIVAVEE